jgi:hypothetical protein
MNSVISTDLTFETIDEASEYLLAYVRELYPHLREFGRRYDNPAAGDHLRIYVVDDDTTNDEPIGNDAEISSESLQSLQTLASVMSSDILAETDFWVSLVVCDAEYPL